jgi:hypothetical protein
MPEDEIGSTAETSCKTRFVTGVQRQMAVIEVCDRVDFAEKKLHRAHMQQRNDITMSHKGHNVQQWIGGGANCGNPRQRLKREIVPLNFQRT